jgi:hypothetical protein
MITELAVLLACLTLCGIGIHASANEPSLPNLRKKWRRERLSRNPTIGARS